MKLDWSDSELVEYHKLKEKVFSNRDKKHVLLDRYIFFLILGVLLLTNFAIAVNLILFCLIIPGLWIYLVLFIIAVSFGSMFDRLLEDISYNEHAKVFYPGMFLASLALINTIVVSELVNFLAFEMNFIVGSHSTVLVACTYTLGFLIPYLFRIYRM